MLKYKKLLSSFIALVFIMIFSLPVMAHNHPGQGIGKGLIKQAEKFKFELNIKNFKEMKQCKIKVKNKHIKFDVPPVIKEGRTLIPVRAITQGLGAEVDWDEKNKLVTITKGDTVIEFDLKDGKVYIDGKETEIDVPPGLINKRVFVPLRFISEVFGEKVRHNPDTNEIDIGDEVGFIKGYVTDKDTGDGIKDVMVVVLDEDEKIQRTRTDNNGRYTLLDVPVGEYTLEFSHDDYHSVLRYDIEVEEDKVTSVNIIMEKVEHEVGNVSGKVTTEEDGEPIRGVKVLVHDGEEAVVRTITGRNGEYSLNDLPAGKYILEFSHDDYETVTRRVIVYDDETSKVNITMSPKYIEEGSISGKVTIEGSRTGIRDVLVRVYDGEDLIARTLTNRNGEYVINDLPAGRYTLEFSHDDYETVVKRAIVKDNTETEVDIKMKEE